MRISEYSINDPTRKISTDTNKRQQEQAASLKKGSKTAGHPLDVTDFAAVVAATPLISIDLIVRNNEGNALLGLRRNRPAQGWWFVPGGRIYKNETLDTAFSRIARSELGIDLNRADSCFFGMFEHFYDINFLGEQGMNTHYVVLAHAVRANPYSMNLPKQQHSSYVWLPEMEIQRRPDIHPYAKAYFRNEQT